MKVNSKMLKQAQKRFPFHLFSVLLSFYHGYVHYFFASKRFSLCFSTKRMCFSFPPCVTSHFTNNITIKLPHSSDQSRHGGYFGQTFGDSYRESLAVCKAPLTLMCSNCLFWSNQMPNWIWYVLLFIVSFIVKTIHFDCSL